MAVLDTSFLIDLAKQEEIADQTLKHLQYRGERLIVPVQVALEYLTGLDDPIEGMRDIESSFQLIPFGKNQALRAARAAREAFAAGAFPGWPDVLIATTALLEQETIITADAGHFRALGCRVWDYRNEEAPPKEE